MTARRWRCNESAVRVRRERGASVVEYALLVALIAIVCVSAVYVFGTETNRTFEHISDNVSNVN